MTVPGGNGRVQRGADGAFDNGLPDDAADGAFDNGLPDDAADGAFDNGLPDAAEAALDALDAEPLEADEAAAGAAAASDEVDESLDERVESVIAELGGVERTREAESVAYTVAGRAFARLGDDRLEAALDATVMKAALRTPDTSAGSGPGWISFTPNVVDRYALDRAEAWVRLAHRRALGR